MIILLLLSIIGLAAIGLGMLTMAVYWAPEGYEDELGFHPVR